MNKPSRVPYYPISENSSPFIIFRNHARQRGPAYSVDHLRDIPRFCPLPLSLATGMPEKNVTRAACNAFLDFPTHLHAMCAEFSLMRVLVCVQCWSLACGSVLAAPAKTGLWFLDPWTCSKWRLLIFMAFAMSSRTFIRYGKSQRKEFDMNSPPRYPSLDRWEEWRPLV